MGFNSFNITQGSCFLSEEIHGAKLSLIMIIDVDYYRKQLHLELEAEDGIADFHMALGFDQVVIMFQQFYFGY